MLMDPSGGPALFGSLMEEVVSLQTRAAELDPSSGDAVSAQVQVKVSERFAMFCYCVLYIYAYMDTACY